ncbi:MAG: DUF3089 domain-containing protein [Sphingomicrobium sp.]
MCVRRFLMLIFILTLIFVGGAFALYQFGDQVLVRMATPGGHYQEPPRGSGPDYAKAESWIARPDITDNPSEWRPLGSAAALLPDHPAAIFYIHPTTYLERDKWNAPLAGNAESDRRARLFVQSQASALASVGRVWAPRYRQAAYGAFLLKSEDARKALDLAFADVDSAFREFLSSVPPDRPIILAGHSQGALHLLRLLERYGHDIKGRVVAAYVVGWPVGATSDLPATNLPACAIPDQAGCVLSWQSFREPANPQLVTDAWVGTTGPEGRVRTREDMLCTNPLSGTRNGAAPAAMNKGTLVPDGDLTNARVEAGRVGARCDNGFLIIDGDVPNLGPYVLPGNNYHVFDYALFWGSIRADVERRLAAWRKR